MIRLPKSRIGRRSQWFDFDKRTFRVPPGSSLDGEQVGSKNLSLGRMMVGFSCREASGAFFVNGLEEEVVDGVQGMDEDGFLISR